ncbi:integrase catalytic domain-containing protein [Actinacidiphila oryziradicis]|uniref:Transposase family protein n=1 Tax=Actinacidiphila oryziradicis TaxID=2571141 RepID=A0A4U0RVM8_9ACTN|nr:DDE-type integrase/transposase/recombinase [Actinacidiphila oryziradicis]TJZ99592.1 transposase family protein [Actinacidiphila oryziradicis]
MTPLPEPESVLSGDTRSLRAGAVRRLLDLQDRGELTSGDIALAARSFRVLTKTVRRWMDNARTHDGTYTPARRASFTLTEDMHIFITEWGGNITAAYDELVADHQLGQPPPSLATFHRAVVRELSPGQRAALRGGEAARRRYDVYGQRPLGVRNAAWETDHVEASVWVNVDGERRKPYITWFVDCATCAICGVAITPHTASSESIMAAVRDAVLTGGHHRPFGGKPRLVRVDRGRDFLSDVVDQAIGTLGTRLVVLPPRSPHLKGTVEALNGAVKKRLFRRLPGYSHTPAAKGDKGRFRWDTADLMPYDRFVDVVLQWIEWWNHDHTMRRLGNRTPAQAWWDDPTPIEAVPPEELHTFTIKRKGNPLKITSKGVRWKGAHYIADWMNGNGGGSTLVDLRHMPHHFDQVELYVAGTDTYLGPADRVGSKDRDKDRAVARSRRREAEYYADKAKKAHRAATVRFAATSEPAPLKPLTKPSTRRQAVHRPHGLDTSPLSAQALPDFAEPSQSSSRWTTPQPSPEAAPASPPPDSDEP